MLTHRERSILGDIPDDWKVKSIRDLIETQFAGSWGDEVGEKAIRVLRSTNLTNTGALDFSDVAVRYFPEEKTKDFNLKKGDILVERSGGGPDQPVGRIAFVESDLEETTVSNFVQVLRPDPEKVHPEFLGWLLFELQRTGIVERVQQQSTQMRNLNWRDYTRLLFPYPEDMSSQAHLAYILRCFLSATSLTENLLLRIERLKKSALNSLFVNGLNHSSNQQKDTKVGAIPEQWNLRTIHSVLLRPPESGISPRSRPEPPGTPILNVSCVKNGICNPDKVTFVDVEPEDIERYKAKKGDFYVLRGNGNRDYVATGGWLREELPESTIYSDKLIRLVFDPDQVAEGFIPYLWQSYQFRTRLQSKAESGSGLWMISKRDIVKELFACPPMEEQIEIIEVMEAIEQQLGAVSRKLAVLNDLKKSLLQNLMTGKIRLPEEALNA